MAENEDGISVWHWIYALMLAGSFGMWMRDVWAGVWMFFVAATVSSVITEWEKRKHD